MLDRNLIMISKNVINTVKWSIRGRSGIGAVNSDKNDINSGMKNIRFHSISMSVIESIQDSEHNAR